jgi:ribosomal protein L32
MTKAGKRSAATRKLWECPRCGASLIARNLSHACGDYSAEKFLEGKSVIGRRLFERFAALIAKCGPYKLAPAKTRVAFMADVRFASVNHVGPDAIDVHFVLPRVIKSQRLRRVERVGKLYVHHLRLRDRRDFDAELAAWLRESYREYGQRRWLSAPASPAAALTRNRSL